jgi:hypothetical protein
MDRAVLRRDASPALSWRLGDPKTQALLIVLFAFLSVMAGFSIGASLSGRPYGDFWAMWSFGRFALSHPAAQIYDLDRLWRFQRAYVPDAGQTPFPYPPFYLLFLLPLGLAPIGLGFVIWSAGGLGAYLAAIFAGRWRSAAVPFIVLAPASIVTLISGQNGFFSAALIVGGLRLTAVRPLLAGALLGLAAFKPQLGLLVPLALISGRAWRCLAAAAGTVLALSAAATAAFGPGIWAAWILAMRQQWIDYVAEGNTTRLKMPTLAASLEQLGMGADAALAVQLAAFLAVAATIWMIFRRRTDRWARAALLAGCFLATPYALFYDLPALSFAILVAIAEMARTDQAWSLGEAAILLAAYLAPYALFLIGGPPIPFAALALALLFVVLARRALTTPPLDVSANGL